MEFKITVRSYDPNVKFEIAQTQIEGIRIKRDMKIREIFPEPIDLIVYIGEHVVLPIAVSLFARMLYDKLKERKDNELTINDESVEINAEKIERVIINLAKEKEKESST